jgi:hypothetical protein
MGLSNNNMDSKQAETSKKMMETLEGSTWSNFTEDQHITSSAATQFYDEFTVAVYQVLVPSLFSVIVVGGLAGNALVIVAVLTCKKLQTVTNYFLVNLSVADVAFLLICGSFSVAHYIIAQWPFGDLLCRLIQYLLYVTCYVVIYTLTFVSFVRYVTIVHGATCAVLRSKNFVVWANVAIWVVCLLAKLPVLLVHGVTFNEDEQRTECIISAKRYGQNLFATFFVFAYGLPLCVICSLYIAIIVHLRKKRSRSLSLVVGNGNCSSSGNYGNGNYGTQAAVPAVTLERLGSQMKSDPPVVTDTSTHPALTSVPVMAASALDMTSSKTVTSPKLTLAPPAESASDLSTTSNPAVTSLAAVKERQRKHRYQATRIIVLVVVAFAMCWLPLHIHLLVAYYGTVPSSHLYKVCVVVLTCSGSQHTAKTATTTMQRQPAQRKHGQLARYASRVAPLLLACSATGCTLSPDA